MSIPKISLKTITEHASSGAFYQGAEYYRQGAVLSVTVKGNDLYAEVQGSEPEPYAVNIHFKNGDVHYADCTCMYDDDGWCKHIVATLLHRLNGSKMALAQPEAPSAVSRGGHWSKQLGALGQAMQRNFITVPAASAQRQLLYIIDAQKTQERQQFTLEVMARRQQKNGNWSEPEAFSGSLVRLNTVPDAHDRQLLMLLYGSTEAGQSSYGYYQLSSYGAPTHYHFSAETVPPAIVPMLCQTGRCLLRRREGSPLQALRYDDGPPWQFWLEFQRRRREYIVSGSLRRGQERRELAQAVLLLAAGLVFFDDTVARLDDGEAFAWIGLLRQQQTISVPRKEARDFLEAIFSLPRQPRLDLPRELSVQESLASAQPCLIIRPIDGVKERLQATLQFEYGGTIIAEESPLRGIFDAKPRHFLLRNADEEEAARQLLRQLGFQEQTGLMEKRWELPASKLPQAVRSLVPAGWQVEAEGKLYRQATNINIQVKSKIDWFELHGKLQFGHATASLTALLEALKSGNNLVRLDDGTFGLLPEEWLKRYGLIAGLGKAKGDHINFQRTQIGFLDALVSAQPETQYDAGFARARRQLRRFSGIKPEKPPVTFVGKLRKYQREGLGWLYFLQKFGFGGCLADDMGLGKTIEALALLESRRRLRARQGRRLGPSLAVVPKSLVFNWQREAARFTPQLRTHTHVGQFRADTTRAFRDYDLIITTYGIIHRDIELLEKFKFDYVILDEAQAVKNAETKSAQAVRRLQGAHRLTLSGTPIENHLGELWSMFEFLNPGLLGSADLFKSLSTDLRNPDEATRTLLARALRPFILRRTKEQVAKELPAKTEQTLYCEMEAEQRKLYLQLRDHYRQSLLSKIERSGLQRSKIFVLEALLRLRQAACHPGLIDKRRRHETSAKLDMLMPQLAEVIEEGHKTLVFSQFTSMLAIVRDRLDREQICYEYLDGRTHDRAAKVDRFQRDEECKVFLISLKAGGLGLNLTAAEYVYLLDPWWNPAVEAQAIDRAHRIGQRQRVFAYRLIVRDTVEEKVLELQQQKRALANAIISEDNSFIRNLKIEDLELLLS